MLPTAPSSGPVSSGPAKPGFWLGLLLQLLLPGSGFTLLGRPWLHLVTLLLTVLDWFAAWVLILYVSYAGLARATAYLPPVATVLIILGVLIFLAAYVLLTVGYVRVYRRPGSVGPAWIKWLLILLHLGGLLLLVLPPLLD
ncbi:hypothetical protein [Deinococcus altitudinis]|uniref:hypothetical protein n=1 Tax=Deinococcus altitudinis TaxID=468914 RepID=UPI003891AF98